jgi:hypothetical protein
MDAGVIYVIMHFSKEANTPLSRGLEQDIASILTGLLMRS